MAHRMDTEVADRMPRRRQMARIDDVASLAGVSTATVDRVLNQRPGVRAVTVQRVLKAAGELGYVVDAGIPVGALKPLRLAFLLPAGSNRFLTMLGRLIAGSHDQLASFNIRARVDYIESFKPELLAQQLRKVGRDVDGVAFMALEHPTVREAVDWLADRRVPAVTLISDIANTKRVAYVGLDNRSAGRTAGYIIARFIGCKPAKVAMIAGSLSYRAHEEREMGFLHLFQELFPAIEVVGLREGHDEEARNYRQTKTLLAQHPDLAGIYNIGGGPEGIARALKETCRQHDVIFVGQPCRRTRKTPHECAQEGPNRQRRCCAFRFGDGAGRGGRGGIKNKKIVPAAPAPAPPIKWLG
jgi:LacI family transcriptional regulator